MKRRGFSRPLPVGIVVGVVVVVLLVPIVVVGTLWFRRVSQVSDAITPVGLAYFEAIGRNDGQEAFDLLCDEAKARTSPAELTQLFESRASQAPTGAVLSGTGPSSFWPWGNTANFGTLVRVRSSTLTRYIELKNETGWRICPAAKTPIVGREPK